MLSGQSVAMVPFSVCVCECFGGPKVRGYKGKAGQAQRSVGRLVRYCRSNRPPDQPQETRSQLALALLVYDLSTRPFHLSDYLLNLQNGQDSRIDWGIPFGRINMALGVLSPH